MKKMPTLEEVDMLVGQNPQFLKRQMNKPIAFFTFSAVVVHICAALDSGAISKLCSKAITSAAILFATCPLMKGRTGSVLKMNKYT